MAIENLPRPWVLAALTGLKVTELLALPEGKRSDRRESPLARPEARRRCVREVAPEPRAASLN